MRRRLCSSPVLAAVLVAGAAAGARDAAASRRGVVLFDTVTGARERLDARAVEARAGWREVSSADHAFVGDAVVLADNLALVVRRQAGGAELYSRSPRGASYRALLTASAGGEPARCVSGYRPASVNRGRVELEAAMACGEGRNATLRFALSAGQAAVRASATTDGARLRIVDEARYLVVPDELAEDTVFGTARAGRQPLPADRLLTSLHDGCGAMLVSVWSSPRQDADVFWSGDGGRIESYEIDLPAGQHVWLSVLEAPGIWHARVLRDVAGGEEIALDWSPPFPARWRLHLAGDDGAGRSALFRDPLEVATGAKRAALFDGRRAVVRPGDVGVSKPRTLVVYPLSRTPATPLAAACAMDVMRDALGSGSCEALLAMEGIADGADRPPDDAMLAVEGELRKAPAQRDVKSLAATLDGAQRHYARAEQRIEAYRKAAREALRLAQTSTAAQAAGATHVLTTALRTAGVESIDEDVGAAAGELDRWLGDIRRVVNDGDAVAKCAAALEHIAAAAAAQRSTLARWRMAFRVARQGCRSAPDSRELADLRAGLERVLFEHSR